MSLRFTARRLLAAFLLSSTAAAANSSAVQEAAQAPSPPPPLSEQTRAIPGRTEARAIAEMLGISPAAASERLALQNQAASWAGTLIAQNPDGFVDVELRHEPTFKVIVFYNGSVDQSRLQSDAPVAIRRYLVFRPVNRNRARVASDTAQVVEALRTANLQFGAFYDLEADKIVVEIPDLGQREAVERAVPAALRQDVTIRRGATARNSGGVYGGNWFRKGSPTATLCTAGWPIRDSGGQAAIITAGHCQPRNPYFPYVDAGIYLGSPFAWRYEISYGKTYDYSIHRLGAHTTSPVIYIANDTRMPDGSVNTVPGFTSAYYAIDSVKPVGQQLVGYLTCKNGARSGFTCGRIESTSYSNATHAALVRVGRSNQPYIAVGGDSGGPVFAYPDGNLISAFGILIASAGDETNSDCKNSATDNSQCFFLYMPFTRATEMHPFQVNTQNGFVRPS